MTAKRWMIAFFALFALAPNATPSVDFSGALSQKFELVADDCQLAASRLITDGDCGERSYLIQFASQADQTVTDLQRADNLLASFESMRLSAYSLNPQELGLLASSPSVTRVVENVEFSLAGVQSPAPWHLERLEQPSASFNDSYSYNDNETGAGVVIYVVDTGVNTSHSQFAGRIGSGFSAIGAASEVEDCNGHGTHVAGLAAGASYGAAKSATITPVRVLDCNGEGNLASVLTGLDWIARNTLVGQPAVVNMSLGGARNSFLDDAIENLTSQGLAFVVAAGNTGEDACNLSPAASPGVISVAASDRLDAWPSFSNFGSCVDLIAPGVQLTSSFIGSANALDVQSGTSMAAAVVSGVVANQMSAGHQSPNALLNALTSTAASNQISGTPAGTPNLLLQDTVVFSSSTGTGGDSLEGVPVVDDSTPVAIVDPNPPLELPATYAKPRVSVDRAFATVSWELPTGAENYSGQVLKVFSGTTELASYSLTATATSFLLSNLAPGIVYRAAIAGVNALGTGALSPFSDSFQVGERLLGPAGGEFSAWTKRISDTQVKFYAKYPQLGEKIQFMVQRPDGRYREIAWLRVTESDLDANGEYIGLQNNIYLIRTITLREGKNRLRIVVDGTIWNRTITYSL